MIASLYEIFSRSAGVSTDSRSIQENAIFFCLKGPNFDGNTFALQALAQGAMHVVADDQSLEANRNLTLVDDVLQTLQELASFHRSKFTFPVIGLTGSNGKTTNKELIHAVLSQKYRTHSTKGNLNNHIGVPLTLLATPLDAEMAIVEMGANHQGEIRDLSAICKPDFGLITNIGKAHLEGFGGIEGVKKGKKELYDFLLAHNRKAFINGDDPVLHDLSAGLATISYGSGEKHFVSGKMLDAQPYLTLSFSCSAKHAHGNMQTQLVGGYNFYNALAAITIGLYFDVPQAQILAGIERYHPENNRSQLVITKKNKVILDAYNANPSSMELAIDNLADAHDEPKIALLGHMMEMGEASQFEHQALADHIASKNLNAIFVGANYSPCNLHGRPHFQSVVDLSSHLTENPLKGYTILLKGSRATTMEKALEQL